MAPMTRVQKPKKINKSENPLKINRLTKTKINKTQQNKKKRFILLKEIICYF